ncbi:MAG: hypothetical protein F4089_04190 [Gammaproteobacteria bacterium]|nr:hypothetical protein [Gammaproteobacteria bacterium]
MSKDPTTDLVERLKVIAGCDPITAIPTSRWEALRFHKPAQDVRETIYMAKNLLELPVERLDGDLAQEIINKHLGVLGDVIGRLNSPSDVEDMDRETLDKIYKQLEVHTKGFADLIGPSMGSLMVRSGSNSLWQIMAETKAAATEVHTARGTINQLASDARDRYDDLLETARDLSAKAAIGLHADKFGKQATDLRKRARLWLRSAVGLGIVSFIAALGIYIIVPEIVEATENVRRYVLLAGGTAIVAIFFSGAVWCGRIYRALIHQATVYEHRQLSLESFMLFIDGSADSKTKDAVLLAAAHAAYGNVPTGLVEQSQREIPVTGPLSQLFATK